MSGNRSFGDRADNFATEFFAWCQSTVKYRGGPVTSCFWMRTFQNLSCLTVTNASPAINVRVFHEIKKYVHPYALVCESIASPVSKEPSHPPVKDVPLLLRLFLHSGKVGRFSRWDRLQKSHHVRDNFFRRRDMVIRYDGHKQAHPIDLINFPELRHDQHVRGLKWWLQVELPVQMHCRLFAVWYVLIRAFQLRFIRRNLLFFKKTLTICTVKKEMPFVNSWKNPTGDQSHRYKSIG